MCEASLLSIFSSRLEKEDLEKAKPYLMKADFGIPVTFDYCQTNNPDDAYRKPNPGMIITYLFYKSASESDCLMIGDATGLPGQFSDSDLRCAQNAGVMYQDVDDFVRQYNPRT